MKLSMDEVRHVAKLARLNIEDQAARRLTEEMNEILAAMDKLAQLDTEGVPPTNHALALTGAMRPDQARPSLDRAQGLANAPESNGESFVVPRVI